MASFFLRWLQPMHPRDVHEPHRVATSLELLFDLIFVVAIASAGQQLHHAIVENHLFDSLALYFMVFFALWWAWMNFTWFTSAYDNDDTLYRVMTMFQMIGALIIAAGIPDAFQHRDFDVIIIGYVVMRTILILQWLRAAQSDPSRQGTIYRYAIGVGFIQVGWIFFHFSPIDFSTYIFVLLVLAELAVPFFAEKYGKTPWHPHHIAERYSLLTIIVLGESIVASFNAISDAFKHHAIQTELIFLTIGGVVSMFTMWWMYFDRQIAGRLNSHQRTFIWGYGHFFIFISIASFGAALAAAVNVITVHAEISHYDASMIIAVTLVMYSVSLWLLHDLHFLTGLGKWFYPFTAMIILAIPLFIANVGYCVFVMSLVYGLRLVVSKWLFKSDSVELAH